jgi:hypothetical protein
MATERPDPCPSEPACPVTPLEAPYPSIADPPNEDDDEARAVARNEDGCRQRELFSSDWHIARTSRSTDPGASPTAPSRWTEQGDCNFQRLNEGLSETELNRVFPIPGQPLIPGELCRLPPPSYDRRNRTFRTWYSPPTRSRSPRVWAPVSPMPPISSLDSLVPRRVSAELRRRGECGSA